MRTRQELQSLLEEMLGSRNVYYQPPESLKMQYPAIVYSKNDIWVRKADNTGYVKIPRYEIIVVDKKPDNSVINDLLDLEYCSYDRHYASENLNHDVMTLYW